MSPNIASGEGNIFDGGDIHLVAGKNFTDDIFLIFGAPVVS